MENGKWKMENERSEPGHLKNGGVDNVKLKTLITQYTNNQYTKGKK